MERRRPRRPQLRRPRNNLLQDSCRKRVDQQFQQAEAESISKSGWLGLFCLQALPLYSNPQRPYLAIGVKELGNWIGVHDQVVQLRDAWLPGMPIRYFIDKPEEEHDMDMNFDVHNDTGFFD